MTVDCRIREKETAFNKNYHTTISDVIVYCNCVLCLDVVACIYTAF